MSLKKHEVFFKILIFYVKVYIKKISQNMLLKNIFKLCF